MRLPPTLQTSPNPVPMSQKIVKIEILCVPPKPYYYKSVQDLKNHLTWYTIENVNMSSCLCTKILPVRCTFSTSLKLRLSSVWQVACQQKLYKKWIYLCRFINDSYHQTHCSWIKTSTDVCNHCTYVANERNRLWKTAKCQMLNFYYLC